MTQMSLTQFYRTQQLPSIWMSNI